MLVVQPWTGDDGEEKLRSIGIGPFIGHGQHVGLVEPVLLRSQLIFECSSPNGLSSCPIAVGASGLIHEPLDDPVENKSVVEAFLGQFDEILACFWAIFKIEE